VLSEAQYNKITEHLRLDILDVERFVVANNCQVISNPRAFVRDSIPSDDGLLSNKIFGITKDDRAGIYAYIDLHGWFLDPSCYKTWIRVDKNIRNIVHGIGTYRINDLGEIVEDPIGKTGIEFLRKNINKIKFKESKSIKRDLKIQYLEQNRNKMFIQKYIVIPPFYRDKNTTNSRVVGLGGINKLYNVPNIHDTQMMFKILESLGCKIKKNNGKIIIDSRNITNYEIPENLMREMRSSVIIAGALLSRKKKVVFTYPGGCDIGSRPIDLHIKSFEKLGVNVKEEFGNIKCEAEEICRN
jgi:hypothetical protein